jgi:branched-chain amino acid transport system permease protein
VEQQTPSGATSDADDGAPMASASAGSIVTAAELREQRIRRAVGLIIATTVLFLNFEQIALVAGPNRSVLIQAVVTGILIGGVYGLVSMGLTLIYGVLHIINFAHGALMTVGMYTAFSLVSNFGLDPYATVIFAVALLLVLGAAIQGLLINRIMKETLEKQLLLTLGLSVFLQNVLLLIFSPTPKAVQLPYARGSATVFGIDVAWPFQVFGAVASLPRTIAFAGAMALAAILYLLLQRTALGVRIRSVADNPRGAALVGIDVQRTYVLVFGLGTACVGAAGALVVPFLSLDPTTGEAFNVIAFVVVVLGGMGNVVGAILGGLIIGLTQQVGGIIFTGQSNLLGVFIVFVLVLFLRPQGLLGRPH